eukprot:2291204-Amphidinium_carterae.1
MSRISIGALHRTEKSAMGDGRPRARTLQRSTSRQRPGVASVDLQHIQKAAGEKCSKVCGETNVDHATVKGGRVRHPWAEQRLHLQMPDVEVDVVPASVCATSQPYAIGNIQQVIGTWNEPRVSS